VYHRSFLQYAANAEDVEYLAKMGVYRSFLQYAANTKTSGAFQDPAEKLLFTFRINNELFSTRTLQ
jgi:hypothetical protein